MLEIMKWLAEGEGGIRVIMFFFFLAFVFTGIVSIVKAWRGGCRCDDE